MAKKIMILNAAQKAWETRRANAAASATLPPASLALAKSAQL
jgi:hypothetical protein